MHGHRSLSEHARMSAPPLVMIPGLGSDAAIWRRTIAALDGVECVVGDTLHDAGLPGMAAAILRSAPERFALAGVSMGGMVALEVVRAAPHRVTHLALLDTMAQPDGWAGRLSRHLVNAVVRVAPDFRRLAARSVGAMVHPSTPDDVRAELVGMSVRVGARTYVRQHRAVAARRDLRPVLPGIAVPTAVIVGAEDRLTPVAHSRAIHERIAGSTLHVIGRCGHLPPIERPEATAVLLRGLLGRS